MKKISVKKRTIFIAIGIAVLLTLWIAFCGWQWSWGPFSSLHNLQTMDLAGNAKQYDLEEAGKVAESSLDDMNICFLGSSVTYGSSSGGVSFADYIGQRNNCKVIKEAVSGTTLVEAGSDSYIARLKKLDANINFDLLICQLSTNDASQNKPLGEISASTKLKDFDTSTITGAIEYIICYAQETWSCPVVFYTNAKFDSEEYASMVEQLIKLQDKWDFNIIDLWNDEEFNNISDKQRDLYMSDKIHPTKAGYLEWWTPKMEEDLYTFIR